MTSHNGSPLHHLTPATVDTESPLLSPTTPASAQAPSPAENMPDTAGFNYWEIDTTLRHLLERYLGSSATAKIAPRLSELGALAGTRIDELSRIADSHPPVLRPYDARGNLINEITYHPAYHELEHIGYEQFGLSAMSHRAVPGLEHASGHVVKYAFWYLFCQGEFSLACPMSMTDAGIRVLTRYGDQSLQDTYRSRLLSLDPQERFTCAQFMTEKQGGSDVGVNLVSARLVDDEWKLSGDKWFCSNASTDIALVLARPEGAVAGTRGLAMFLVPRVLPDGSLNSYRINRIKDKSGTRAMASGEVTFNGATGYVVGSLDQGFKQMMSMVNSSRLSNAMRSAALIRRAYVEALTSTRGRWAFGSPIAQKPLMQGVLWQLLSMSEAAISMVLHTAAISDRADAGSSEDALLLRLLTPILKGVVCKNARLATTEAMEARGGNGFIEDWVDAKLVRDAQVGSIWEGTTNIVALDVIRALVKDGAGEVFFADLSSRLHAVEQSSPRVPVRAVIAAITKVAEGLRLRCDALPSLADSEREARALALMRELYTVTAASVLLESAAAEITRDGNHRSLCVAAVFLQDQLDPLAAQEPESDLREQLDALIDHREVSEAVAAQMTLRLTQRLGLRTPSEGSLR